MLFSSLFPQQGCHLRNAPVVVCVFQRLADRFVFIFATQIAVAGVVLSTQNRQVCCGRHGIQQLVEFLLAHAVKYAGAVGIEDDRGAVVAYHAVRFPARQLVMGMRYGINLNINLTERKNFYFSTGLFAEHTGGKMKFLDNIPIGSLLVADSIPTQRTYRSIYLTVPTMITLKTNSINNFFICGNAGLLHSFSLNATATDSYTIDTETWSRETKDSQETALFKEAFIAGVGFEYSVTANMRAGLMVNYVQTFTNYFKGKGKAQNSLSKLDQRANLGYVEIALNINFF